MSPDAEPAADPADDWVAYQAAQHALLGLIHRDHRVEGTATDVRARQVRRFARFQRFMASIGDPQHRFRVVHVTGTSGKGSTATMIAHALTAAGHRTGLVTSPYLQSATERIQVDGALISGRDFLQEVEHVLAAGRAFAQHHGEAGEITYGEAGIAAAFCHLARAGVEFAVVEVAAGGRFDLTNVVRSEVAVVTTVGPDHLVTLGPTLRDVAWHKAGIIKSGVQVVTGVSDPRLLEVIAAEASRVGAGLAELPVLGESDASSPSFQRHNQRLAVGALAALRRSGVSVSDDAIAEGLRAARLPGRFEQIPPSELAPVPVLLDGAHNSEKMAGLVASLPRVTDDARKPVVLLGLLASKDEAHVVETLLPATGAIVATEPEVYGKSAHPASRIAETVRSLGFAGPVQMAAEPRQALDLALALAEERGTSVVVTGSLYLVGNVRERWFATEEIVRQRTPWPAAVPRASVKQS